MNRNNVLVIVGAIILCFAGLNNKFPLLTADTGGYIDSGFIKKIPFDRPLLYGLFVAHASWGKSLWLVIFSQALALSLLLYYYFRYFSRHVHSIVFYMACLFFIVFFMLASVTASTIDPGIFAGISILCCGLLLFADNLNKRDFSIIAIAMVIGAGMDVLYLATLASLVIIYGLGLTFAKNNDLIKTNIKRIAIALALIIAGGLLVSTVHALTGADFSVVRNCKIAMLPRLATGGFTKAYLDTHCREDSSIICSFKDDLDTLATSGGRLIKPALANEEQQAYLEIAEGIISQPGFCQKLATQSAHVFFNQLISVQTGKEIETDPSIETIKSIFSWYNEDVREYYNSRQMQGWLTFRFLNFSQIISLIFCIFILAWVSVSKSPPRHRTLFLYIFMAYVIHALLSAILYGKINMQGQIAWLVAIPVFLYLSEVRSNYKWVQKV